MIVPPNAITGWDFFRALLGCAADSPRVGPLFFKAPIPWINADTVPSSVLPAFAIHPVGARRARAGAPCHRGAGVGAAGGIPDAQPGRDHAGAGGGGLSA